MIIERIKRNLQNLSNKQKKIAKYLIKNKNKIAFMSLKELSNELEVTEVTILNFCKAVGIESFTNLKKEFQDLIKEELKVPAKMKSSLEELISIEDAVKNTIQIQKRNFDKIIQNNTIEHLHAASRLIENARMVYICGLGVSRLVCDFLQPRFNVLNIDARILNLEDMTLFCNNLIRANKEDLFILISFPNYSEQIIKLSQYLAMKKLTFIAITNSDQSPIAQNAEVVLKAENHSLVFYNFISATIALAEWLLVVLSYNMKEKIIPDIKEVEELSQFFRCHKKQQKKQKCYS